MEQRRPRRYALLLLSGLLMLQGAVKSDDFRSGTNFLALPSTGSHQLQLLSPTVLELSMVTTQTQEGKGRTWDFADENGQLRLPPLAAFRVQVNGKKQAVKALGFRRRVLYAPLRKRDLRVGNYLTLQFASALREGDRVEVTNPDKTLWPPQTTFSGRFEPMRWSPAIHVNQVGYVPDFPKKAFVGYYLGSMGEMAVPSQEFRLVKAVNGRTVFSGRLTLRRDRGWEYAVKPYQQVYEADFSAFQTPGEYRLFVPGLGASFPFFVHHGIASAFARAYALGIYHQRCGGENALPFTRFTHPPCHTAPAEVPTADFAQVQRVLALETGNAKENPRHTAPPLNDIRVSLYPFVRTGKIDVAGGHHDAGDYSKYTINSAQFIHTLVFAADSLPGVGELDNLGLPESGDGKSDLLQLAKWEADFLVKMQDEDGGFYFLVYPRDRRYEQDVLPEHGDPQVVFPKTTAVTASAVAALAQMASSPRFKKQFPDAAAQYLRQARKGWEFLERARAKHGDDGAYQKITHYGDAFMHDDEIAWAATEMFLATGDSAIHSFLRSKFDPTDPETRHWGWERLYAAYGCAIRAYAFAAQSGRIAEAKLDRAYLNKCRAEIKACGQDQQTWASASAYGTSFPTETKRFRGAGWYFSLSQAFDITVANALDARPEYLDAILTNLNYEGGANPVNVTFITGLGWKRQREIVHHYALNDRRVLPPSGIPLGNIQEGFMYLESYKRELGQLTYPPDGDRDNPYPFYDRWGDSFNVATEFVTPNQARGLATLAALMARTPLKNQPWRSATARIAGLPEQAKINTHYTLRLQADDLDVRDAHIVWESDGQEPQYGLTYSLTLTQPGSHWVEAEAQLPDGRRVFATREIVLEASSSSRSRRSSTAR